MSEKPPVWKPEVIEGGMTPEKERLVEIRKRLETSMQPYEDIFPAGGTVEDLPQYAGFSDAALLQEVEELLNTLDDDTRNDAEKASAFNGLSTLKHVLAMRVSG